MSRFDVLIANARDTSLLLKALGNDRRLVILAILADGEHSVGQLEGLVGLSQSALSQHLARLRRDGLVATRRSAQQIFYRLADGPVLELLERLAQIVTPARTRAALRIAAE